MIEGRHADIVRETGGEVTLAFKSYLSSHNSGERLSLISGCFLFYIQPNVLLFIQPNVRTA